MARTGEFRASSTKTLFHCGTLATYVKSLSARLPNWKSTFSKCITSFYPRARKADLALTQRSLHTLHNKKNTTYPAIQMRVFLVYINLDDLKAHIDESQLSSTKTSGASNEHEPPTPKKNRHRRDSAKHERRTNHCQLWIVKTVLLSLYLPSKAFASLKLYG